MCLQKWSVCSTLVQHCTPESVMVECLWPGRISMTGLAVLIVPGVFLSMNWLYSALKYTHGTQTMTDSWWTTCDTYIELTVNAILHHVHIDSHFAYLFLHHVFHGVTFGPSQVDDWMTWLGREDLNFCSDTWSNTLQNTSSLEPLS